MSKIQQNKNYTGADLETIFFRPILSGPDAQSLGIKIMYNMPVPTTLHFWKRDGDILQKFTQGGWNGSAASSKFQKTIELHRVKAEVGYGADDYFNLVFAKIVADSNVNMDDLSGTNLEQAETALFKESIAESIRATMWLGKKDRSTNKFATFDGFIQRIQSDIESGETQIKRSVITPSSDPDSAETILKKLWDNSNPILREFKSQGNLVYLVTSDIYAKYEEALDNVALDSAYLAKQNGREGLSYRGIPVIDLQLSGYLSQISDLPPSFAILTDRRNLALAVNTANFPGTEVKMWYNPDVMENRQRAVFMAGCDYLLPELISFACID